MNYKFDEDFSCHDEDGKPCNIVVERNSDFEHGHALIQDDEYHIPVYGNKHFATTPPLRNFKLTSRLGLNALRFGVEDDLSVYGFRIYFRYDRFLKEGYLLECGLSPKTFHATLIALDRRHGRETLRKIENPASKRFRPSDFKVALTCVDDHFTLSVAGVDFSLADDKRIFNGAGSVGVDQSFFSGELILKRMTITSDDPINKTTILGPLSVELPKIHGMSVAYRYGLRLSKFENGPYELEATLSGGIRERPDRGKCGKQWTHEIDRLTTPYVRLESPEGEIVTVSLFSGTKTLLDREEQRPWTRARYPQIQWPLKRKMYFERLPKPEELFFAVGYERFFGDPKRFLTGGPFEVLIDGAGEILWSGDSLRKGRVAVTVTSPENRRLTSLIPKNLPNREAALRHARENHYFNEGDKITFDVEILFHDNVMFPDEFELNVEPRSVFGDELGESVTVVDVAAEDDVLTSLGISRRRYGVAIGDGLSHGVYHVNVELRRGIETLYHENVIFEVMSEAPDAVAPPLAVGLPTLFSIPNEIKYLQTDAFDPLYEKSGTGHYFSVSCFYPDYARASRIWELLKLYKRKWFAVIDSRSTPNDCSIEANADLVAQCDYLQIPLATHPRHGRYELWKGDIYKGEILDALIEFFQSHPRFLEGFETISPRILDDLKNAGETLPESAFVELVARRWNEWLAFFSDKYAGFLKDRHDAIAKINNKAKIVTGGPFSIYAAHNKSAYFLSYFGHTPRGGTRRYFNGFWQFEDYPHSCGYSCAKAPFAMATIKLHYPQWMLYPEIYAALNLDGCNDGAVYQANPPYGSYDLPVALMRGRIYEYAFATTWFADGEFHYWRDNGFHLRNPQKTYVEQLLRAWGNTLRHKPVKPVRTTSFLVDADLIAQHPDHYERNCNLHPHWKDVINTAEESLVYAYDSARGAGLPAGFAMRMDGLRGLTADLTDLLILPPIGKGAPKECLDEIRRLHRQGVNLLGSESVYGLEDLFGVVPLEKEIDVQRVGAAAEYASKLAHLDDEFAEHELCVARHRAVDDAVTILVGSKTPDGARDIPVLVTRKTRWGRTAFFNIPPTTLKRDSFVERIGYGQECVSPLMKAAMTFIVRSLSSPMVEVDSPEAKLIAFHDQRGDLVVVVEQERLTVPDLANYPQSFLVTLNLPGIKEGSVRCDEPFSIARRTDDQTVLRTNLGKYESAFFVIRQSPKRRRHDRFEKQMGR